MTPSDAITVYTASHLAGRENARDYELVDGELMERYTRLESSGVASKFGRLLGIEAVSTNDMASAAVAKVRDYLDHRFPLVWVAQPLDQTVTVYRPGQPVAVLSPGQEIAADPVRPAFRCDVALLVRSNAHP